MLSAVIDELFVDLVGENQKVLFLCQGGNLLKHLSGINHTGGIAGSVQDQ